MHLSWENGLTRYADAPAARICAMSRRESRAVSMITGIWRSSGSRRSAWTSSNPVITGIS